MPALDNFYAKQEADGAIRGDYRSRTASRLITKDNPEGVLPPLFAWAEYNIYHKIGLKKRVKDVVPILQAHYRVARADFKKDNGLYAVPLAATRHGQLPAGGTWSTRSTSTPRWP